MRDEGRTADSEHRDLARGLNGGLEFTALVEAGAGTGKTSVLVDRLLSMVRAGVSVSRIVAITFTEKAAGELRVRFRTHLEDAAGAARVAAAHAATKAAARDGHEADAPDSPGAQAELLDAALRGIDRANIGTIHSFCGQLLRERPVEAGIDPDFGVADQLRRTVLLESAWDKWIRNELSSGLPADVAEAHFRGTNLFSMQELAFKLVENRDAVRLLPDPIENGDAAAFAGTLRGEAEDMLRFAVENCEDDTDRGLPAVRRFADEARALDLIPEDSLASFALSRVTVEPGRNSGSKSNWKGDSLAALKKRAAELKQRQSELSARASHNATVGLLGWLAGFLDEYEREKAASGVLDFQDLLSRTRDLLRDDDATREHFKRAFDRILVDEFQDTDPLQCEIVFFLSERQGANAAEWNRVDLEPGKLFIVGDPKQSIYRFRRADIEMYEEAKSLIDDDGRIFELSQNFRTRPAVVDCVNSTFRKIMVPPEEGGGFQPEYEPLHAFRPEDEAGPGIILIGSPAEAEKVAETRQVEATAVAAFVKSMLEQGRPLVCDRKTGEWRPPRLGDIAILFHRLTGLDAYEEALNTYDLDYRIAGGKRFYVRREVYELKTVLAAVDDPNDLVSVLGALRTPFFGVSDEDIVVHRHETGGLRYLDEDGGGSPAVLEAFRVLRDLHYERNSRSVADIIRRLFDRTGALELYLLKPTGEQRHANLLKVVEMATSLEAQDPMSFGGFVRWLADVSKLSPEEAESPLSEEGDQFIRVLTIHKAKGLEFPITILADLGRHEFKSDNLIVDRDEGRLEYGKNVKDGGPATLGYEDLKALEKQRAEAETIRLLYVGLTRARDAVVVPWFPTKGTKPTGLLPHLTDLAERASDDKDPLVTWVDAGTLDLGVERSRPLKLDLHEAMETDPEDTRAALDLAEWTRSLNAFAPGHYRPPRVVTPSSLAGEEELELPEDAPRYGAALGTLVHSVMEHATLGSTEGLGEVVSLAARGSGAPPAHAEEAERMVVRAMRSDVIARATRSDACFREVPFVLHDDGAYVEGTMDLLFVEDGKLVVVDYKTDARPVAGFGELVKKYEGQALAYAVAAERTTGLPLGEVVLLFLSGDGSAERDEGSEGGEATEERVSVGATTEERERALRSLVSSAS